MLQICEEDEDDLSIGCVWLSNRALSSKGLWHFELKTGFQRKNLLILNIAYIEAHTLHTILLHMFEPFEIKLAKISK